MKMPQHALRRCAVPVLWLLGVIDVIWSGCRPDPYLEYVRHIPPPHPYPTSTVFLLACLMAGHAILLVAILRPVSYVRAWGRALAALAISLCFFFLSALSMHGPPAWGAYIIWEIGIVLAAFIMTVRSGLGAARHVGRSV